MVLGTCLLNVSPSAVIFVIMKRSNHLSKKRGK
ncbi:hypothetical protein P615_11160 [Brevibacillus laterosporus PE36]|nr:hypothetical protein P615_11160 [Brevibacillus laterosporus PE36]